MRYPKTITTFCPKCKKHTVHTVSLYKKGKERAMSRGARKHAEEKKGYGGQKYPELIRTAKTTKKATIRLKCKDCGFTVMKKGMRLRKLEIVE